MDFPVLTLGLGSRKKAPREGSSRLMQVENLEERITPAGTKYVSPKLSFTVVNVGDADAMVQGRVTGTYSANSTVTFSGATGGTITTDSNGYFTYTGDANCLGSVTGIATDTQGTQTSAVTGVLTSLPPSITSFTATRIGVTEDGLGIAWVLSGTVLNEGLEGVNITFSGVDSVTSATATTDSTGYFSVVVVLEFGENGTVWATATDAFGETGMNYDDIGDIV